MNAQVDKHLIKAVVDVAVWLEFSDSKIVDPDAAVQAMEQLAAELQLMAENSKTLFAQQLAEIAKDYNGQKAEFVATLPETLGLFQR